MCFNIDMHRLLQPHFPALNRARKLAASSARLNSREFVEQALSGVTVSDALVTSWRHFLSLRPDAQEKIINMKPTIDLDRFDPQARRSARTGRKSAPDLRRMTPEILANEARRFADRHNKMAVMIDTRGSREDFLKERSDLRRR